MRWLLLNHEMPLSFSVLWQSVARSVRRVPRCDVTVMFAGSQRRQPDALFRPVHSRTDTKPRSVAIWPCIGGFFWIDVRRCGNFSERGTCAVTVSNEGAFQNNA